MAELEKCLIKHKYGCGKKVVIEKEVKKLEKKAVSGIILTLLLTNMLTLAFNIQPVKAEPSTWTVDDDGTANFSKIQEAINAVSPGDTIIVRAGTYVENVEVGKANLTIKSENGAEATFVQAAFAHKDVFRITADYINLIGFVATGATYYSCGIHLKSSSYCNITGNIAFNNTVGIGLEWYADHNYLSDNKAFNNSQSGLFLGSSSSNKLRNNTLSGNKYNFWIGGFGAVGVRAYVQDIDTSNTVDGKPILYWVDEHDKKVPQGSGFVAIVDSTNITIEDLTLRGNSQGVLLVSSTCSRIERVTVSGSCYGIALLGSQNNQVLNSNTANNTYGIYLEYGSNNSVKGNSLSGDNAGVALSNSLYNEVSDNSFNAVSFCIGLGSAHSNTIVGNRMKSNGKGQWNVGIYLSGSWYNNISLNDIEGSGFGIYLTDVPGIQTSKNNTIWQNRFANNTYGLYSYSSVDNAIYLNNFVENTNNVYVWQSANSWKSRQVVEYTYDGKTYENYLGNYWSDYTERYPDAKEIDGSGIWDTPYVIDEYNRDRYPLIKPWTPTPPPPPPPVPPQPPQPVNLSPADGATDVLLTPTLCSSPPLQDVEPDLIPWEEIDGIEVTKIYSQWQITTIPGDYSDPIYNVTILGLIDRRFFPALPEVWSTFVPSGVLEYGTTYYWRVRHRDFRGVWSPWSEETSFTTWIDFYYSPKKPIVGEEITFNAIPSPYVVSYEWSFGDGNTDYGEIVTHSYSDPGDYTVTLTVTNVEGVTVSTRKVVKVAREWTFAIVTDLHIGRGWYDYGADGFSDYYWDGTAHDGNEGGFNCLMDRLTDVVKWINDNYEEENIRFLVILGDITDSAEMSEFFRAKRILDGLEIPYFPVIGNHDVWSKTEEKVDDKWKETVGIPPPGDLYFDRIFSEEFFEQQFEKLGATWWDKQRHTAFPYLQNYAFSYGGISFITLDYVDRDVSELGGLIACGFPETENWLESNMKNRPEKKVIVFSHYPFMLEGGVDTSITGHLGRTALMYSRDVFTFGGHIHYCDNRNLELFNTVYFLEIGGIVYYYEYPRLFATPVSVPVVVTKGMMEADKDFLRIVKAEGTYTTPNKIDYTRIVELDTCEIPDGPAPEIRILGTWLHPCALTKSMLAKLGSPGELRVYDSQGRVTGLVNGEVKNEIPLSRYFDGSVWVLSAVDSYRYQVVGTEEGSYNLEVTSVTELGTITFASIDTPTSANAIHQYTVDWAALSLGEEGVTVQIDSDGDGTFEQTISSDNKLTHDEFMLQTATTIDFDPDTLNLKSKGNVTTVYIELPEGYDVNQIDVSSIMLNGTVPALAKPTSIGDYDGDGIPDLMVKFDIASVIALFAGKTVPGNYVMEVTGTVADIRFKGTDTIRVISPP